MVQIPILQHFQKIKARFQRGTRHKPPDFFLCEFRFGGSVPITEKKVLVTSFNVAGKVTDQWRTKLWSRPSVSISANNREVSVEHRVLWFVKSSRLPCRQDKTLGRREMNQAQKSSKNDLKVSTKWVQPNLRSIGPNSKPRRVSKGWEVFLKS